MNPHRKAASRWWVWALVPLAAAAGAWSAFADSAVRVTDYKYGAVDTYGLSIRVWGVHLRREIVHGTLATLRAQALTRERQWRWGLSAASACVGGGLAAVVAATLFVGRQKLPQWEPGVPPESDSSCWNQTPKMG